MAEPIIANTTSPAPPKGGTATPPPPEGNKGAKSLTPTDAPSQFFRTAPPKAPVVKNSDPLTGANKVLTPIPTFPIKPPVTKETTWERYGTNVVYQDFSKINFPRPTSKRLPLPFDLADAIKDDWKYLKDEFTSLPHMRKLILDEAKKLGFTPDKIRSLPARQAIKLAVRIVTHRLKYHLVDNDKAFIRKYGAHLPKDAYFELGLGDCDKYADLFKASFRTIKRLNPALRNVYVGSGRIGAAVLGPLHAWNSLFIVTKDRLLVSHIDPTFYDSSGSLEAKWNHHLPSNYNLFLANFHSAIRNPRIAYRYFMKGLKGKVSAKKTRWILLRELAPFVKEHNPSKGAEVVQLYRSLEPGANLSETKRLKYEWSLFFKTGHKNQAFQAAKKLFEKETDPKEKLDYLDDMHLTAAGNAKNMAIIRSAYLDLKAKGYKNLENTIIHQFEIAKNKARKYADVAPAERYDYGD